MLDTTLTHVDKWLILQPYRKVFLMQDKIKYLNYLGGLGTFAKSKYFLNVKEILFTVQCTSSFLVILCNLYQHRMKCGEKNNNDHITGTCN